MKFKLLLTATIVIFLTACDDGYRDSPQQQVEDMKICRDGEMEVYLTVVGEIKCIPKDKEYANFKK